MNYHGLQSTINFLKKKNCTLLGVGPMSLNCIDAVCEISNGYSIPLMLIASRRQIDSKKYRWWLC